MKKIIISLVFFSLFIFGFSTHISYAAVHDVSAVISPTIASTGQNLDYTYTITNGNSSTSNIGSAEIQLSTSFINPSISILSASPGRTWVLGSSDGFVNGFNSTTGIIRVAADGSTSKLDINEFVTIKITTVAPATPGSYEWTVSSFANLGFSGTLFSLTSSQPTVIVSLPADTVLPVITLTGENIININVGDTYTDAGATALDDIDGDITSSIVKGGTYIDSGTAGTYTVTYDVSDIAGNKATTITRTINVNAVSGGGGGGNSDVFFGGNIVLLDNCEIEDANGIKHNFPQENSPSKYLGICALSQAKEQGIINDIKLDYYSGPDGLFVNSINGISKENTYWALYLNDVYEMSRGLSILPLSGGDKVSLILTTYSGEIVLPKNSVEINIISLQQPEEQKISYSGGGGSSQVLNNKFDVDKALAYLVSKQNSDGSFISPMYTDWAGIAFASQNTNLEAKEKLINYFKITPFISDIITDNERHAMALMSLGINPYSGTNINYIKKIADSFDGTQFGDSSLINDDIFAIFPLIKAGYSVNDEMIKKDISYIISKQSPNGSWESVDMTGAGLQALKGFENISGVPEAISKAQNYLIVSQGSDGGFENSFSTSWALQSLTTLNPKAGEYLAGKQQTDGGLEFMTDSVENRVWATSYAVPAVLGKSWNDLIQEFPKPIEEKITKIPEVKSVKKLNPISVTTKVEAPKLNEVINLGNNLTASAGNVTPVKISVGKMSQAVVHSVVGAFIYIGKSFYHFITFFRNMI